MLESLKATTTKKVPTSSFQPIECSIIGVVFLNKLKPEGVAVPIFIVGWKTFLVSRAETVDLERVNKRSSLIAGRHFLLFVKKEKGWEVACVRQGCWSG